MSRLGNIRWGDRSTRPSGVRLLFLLGILLVPARASATVTDITVSDVTTRAFALVWISDQVVLDASVRVFAEPAGTTDLTAGLSQTLISGSFPPALDQGIVKVSVEGLSAATCVYAQTETQIAAGTVLSPAGPPFIEICTEVA